MNLDDDDVDIATDSEEGELDIPKPLPKVLTPAQKKKKERKERVLSKWRGRILQTILSPDVEPCRQEVTWDEDPEIVCSYNWSSAVDGSNTIYVPGAPTKWTPQDIPYNVPGDAGFHPTDYNYVRQPGDPFSAVFHAMAVANPDFALKDCDILADRNNLRVLLEVVQGKTVGPFRLDLYLIFNTLIIVRREDGFWRRSDGKSYGFNFEKHFTTPTPDMTDATSHYRAIRYRMGPLRVVCRFEADAYVDTTPDILSESEAATVIPPIPMEPDLMKRPQFSYHAPFKVLQKGHIVPGNQLLELKTQVERPREEGQSNVSCQDQLWFGRTTHLYTGRYEAGTGKILKIKKEDATERVKRWEDKNQEELRKLVGLLIMLRGICREQEGPSKAVILVREDPRGPLVVHKMQNQKKIVQREFFERHWLAHARSKRANSIERYQARGGMRGGRGRGQVDGQRGGYAHRGQADAQSYRSLGLRRAHPASDPNYGRLNTELQPRSHHDAPRGASRGRPGHRGRGNGSRAGRGRGNSEQGQG